MGKVNLSIKLKNHLNDLDKIKKAVLKLSTAIDCTKQKFQEINLILEELFTNVVCHGFNDDKEHDIDLSLSCDEKSLTIRMEDDGKSFDFTSAAAPDTKCAIEKRFVGGLGIHFVKYFADDCQYYRKKGKNIIVLKKYITDDEHADVES
ncbi:MAG: ATP-binding protein [Desulfobacula sp.]|uniref:ATP-binding protein n=1 Tax=Desulfobacula sp. TaxID=2593537 RepID=UPI0025BAB613|nr:ATP-binding protein [Desulfobacula sp.]MCD4720959.1 ATP-binding protein [Desulfobacula sp.]